MTPENIETKTLRTRHVFARFLHLFTENQRVNLFIFFYPAEAVWLVKPCQKNFRNICFSIRRRNLSKSGTALKRRFGTSMARNMQSSYWICQAFLCSRVNTES